MKPETAQILRITTASESAFPNSQHVLQPYKQYSVGNLAVQHSDIALSVYSIIDDNRRPKDGLINHKLLSQSEANDLAQHLQEKLYLDGLYFHDNHVDNVAIMADGRLVTPDPGAVFTTEQHQQYLATLDDDLRIRKTQQWEAVAERAASNQHLHKKGMGAVGLLMSAGVVLASGVAEASNTQGGLDEKAKAFKDASLNNVADVLPVVNAEKAMQEGKPNEAIARLADWTPAGEPNRYLQRLYAAATGKPTDVEAGMVENFSQSVLGTMKYAATKANEGLDNLQEAIGTPTKRSTDAEKLANKQAFLHATGEIMAGNINYKAPENSHIVASATVDIFLKQYQRLAKEGGINENDMQALNMARDKMAQGFDAPRYAPFKEIITKYEATHMYDNNQTIKIVENNQQQAELTR